MAASSRLTRREIESIYTTRYYERLWSGSIQPSEFWSSLARDAGTKEPGSHWEAVFLERLTPLPALSKVPVWARGADVLILSNHRPEWLYPLLEPVTGSISRILISSEIGVAKPSAEAFDRLLEALPAEATRVLFVDDAPPNIEAARLKQLPSLLTDPDGAWTATVDAWLENGS